MFGLAIASSAIGEAHCLRVPATAALETSFPYWFLSGNTASGDVARILATSFLIGVVSICCYATNANKSAIPAQGCRRVDRIWQTAHGRAHLVKFTARVIGKPTFEPACPQRTWRDAVVALLLAIFLKRLPDVE
jgi:hypothetical protein